MTKPLETKEEIQKFYSCDDVSGKYIEERFKSPIGLVMHERQVRFVNEAIKQYGVKNILEFAPGPARISAEIIGFNKGTMVEYNENMLKIARDRIEKIGMSAHWNFVREDAFKYASIDKFDLIYSFRFIRHFKQEMRSHLYSSIRDLLNDKGLFIFDAPNLEVEKRIRAGKDADKVYDELYTKEVLVKELEDNGFSVIKTVGVWAHYTSIQYLIQVLIGPRWPRAAYHFIKLLECDNASHPVEWIVLCQKK